MKPEVKALIDQFVENIPNNKTPEGQAESDRLLNEVMALTVTPEEKKEAGQYLTKAMCRRRRPDIDAKKMMEELAPALSLSYIAENYFGKSKPWLYQRINNSVVNGKPVSFTQEELKKLADSLGDLSNRLSALSTFIHRSL